MESMSHLIFIKPVVSYVLHLRKFQFVTIFCARLSLSLTSSHVCFKLYMLKTNFLSLCGASRFPCIREIACLAHYSPGV